MGIKNANGYSWRISRLFQMFSTANMGLLFEIAKDFAKKKLESFFEVTLFNQSLFHLIILV